MSPELLSALGLSIRVACLATVLDAALGIPLAYLLARKRFPGRTLVDLLVTLPLVLPPTVTGYYLIVLLGRRGWLGGPLYALTGWSVTFTWYAAVIAASVMAFPLLVRTARVAIESVDRDLVRAAFTLGRSDHYPNDRLPADYALPSDRPTVVALRPVHPGGRLFRELAALAQAHDFRVLLVPTVLRRGRFAPAPAPSSDGPEPIAGSDRVERIGPDYVLLPAPQFSDSTHLNRHGAREYSQYLARLLQATLR